MRALCFLLLSKLDRVLVVLTDLSCSPCSPHSSSRPSSPSGQQPKPTTNKRFLSSMIRSVDDHNQSLIRQQAAQARGSRDAAVRGSPSRTEYKGREEDVEEGSGRRSGGGMRAWDWDEVMLEARRGEEGRTEGKRKREDKKSRSRSPETSRRRRTRSSRSPPPRDRERSGAHKDRHREDGRRRRRERSRTPEGDEDEARRWRRRERERESGRDDDQAYDDERRRRRRHERDREDDDDDKGRSRSRRSRDRLASSPPPPVIDQPSAAPITRPRSPTPETHDDDMDEPRPALVPSKMDRYFEETYDPRLDVAPVPKSGLVGEEYERMLDVLKEKEREKEEAKRKARRVRSPFSPSL